MINDFYKSTRRNAYIKFDIATERIVIGFTVFAKNL